MSNSIKIRQAMERKIVRSCVEELISNGYMLHLDNGGDEFEIENSNDAELIIKNMMETDREVIYTNKPDTGQRFVLFVYGNDGWDVIADYSVRLEPDLKKTLELSEKLESEDK